MPQPGQTHTLLYCSGWRWKYKSTKNTEINQYRNTKHKQTKYKEQHDWIYQNNFLWHDQLQLFRVACNIKLPANVCRCVLLQPMLLQPIILQPMLLQPMLLAKTSPHWHLPAAAFERLRSTDLENPHCNHNLARLWAEAFDWLDYIRSAKHYLSAPPKIWFGIICLSEQGHKNEWI